VRRRDFLAAAALSPLLGCAPATPETIPVFFQDGGLPPELGHRLRDAAFSSAAPGVATEVRRVPVLICGAGIGGLSAAWRLAKRGFKDFALLEMGAQVGGNSRFGENAVSPYPLGAHYLPLPPREARFVREILADLGGIEADPFAIRPTFSERLLCHTPQERVFFKGIWQEGILPQQQVPKSERAEIARFHDAMEAFKHATDAEGRRAFAIPLDLSSPDPKWRALDRVSMLDWMRTEGYTSPVLHWYGNYACRDDFGTDIAETSAWAGIHYFACRNGEAANAANDAVLTAPEGNGWIVRALEARLAGHITRDAIVFRVAQDRRQVEADVWLAMENRAVRYVADQLIWAAPLFVLARLAQDLPADLAHVARSGSHAPWLLASLSLREAPQHGAGAPLAWDNVLYGGTGLGYVVATHQHLALRPGQTVFTWYHAMSGEAPATARKALLESPPDALAKLALDDLSRAHHDIRRLTERIDLTRHGHAMIRPTPGAIWNPDRSRLSKGWQRVLFAHADVSGVSLFEEANYRGVLAADAVLARS
jgi:monoamine oxidase